MLKSGYFLFSFGKIELVLFDPYPEGVLKKKHEIFMKCFKFQGKSCSHRHKLEMDSGIPVPVTGSSEVALSPPDLPRVKL